MDVDYFKMLRGTDVSGWSTGAGELGGSSLQLTGSINLGTLFNLLRTLFPHL